MAVSGSFDWKLNRDEAIKDAFVEAGVLRPDETPESPESTYAARRLNGMLKAFQSQGLHLWMLRDCVLFLEKDKTKYSLGPSGDNCTESYTETAIKTAASSSDTNIVVDSISGVAASDNIGIQVDDGTMHWTTVVGVLTDTITITTGIDDAAAVDNVVYVYTNKIQRPLRINNAVYRVHSDSSDRHLYEISRQEYWDLSAKTTESESSQFWFDPQLTNAEMNLYGEPVSVKDTIRLICQFPFDDMDAAANDFSFPIEWQEAIHYNLSYRLATSYRPNDPKTQELRVLAKRSLDQAKGFDEERSNINLRPDRRWVMQG
jgi:hypothetical protein